MNHTGSAALVFLLLASAPTAHGGDLAKTARGVDNAQGHRDHRGSTQTPSHPDLDRRTRQVERNETTYTTGTHIARGVDYTVATPARPIQLGPPSGHVRVAAQNVRDSDGSFRVDGTVLAGRFGFYGSFDHYFESISGKSPEGVMSEDIRLNLYEVSVVRRVIDGDVVRADLRGGMAVASSSHFDPMAGGTLGLQIQVHPHRSVQFLGEVQGTLFTHDIKATEAALGVQLHLVYAGYRALKFDVGPALIGPEIGVRLEY